MAADDDLPWNTSRCNRLLRPLSSKLAKLRRELERPRSSGGEKRNASAAFATKGSPQKTTNFTRPAHRPRGFDKARDPDWRPGAKAGASKKTYGSRGAKRIGIERGSSNNGSLSRPGEIAFTPLIARMGGQLHSSPQLQASPLRKYTKNRGPLLANVDQIHLGKHMLGDLHKLIQGLSEAYANILQATSTGGDKRWKGTRSLMSACLRNLPAYIELEEHFAKLDRLEEDEDEGRDVAIEIYEHLEAQFEQRTGQGWRPFKQVVRAHGTSLLCAAVADGILGLESLSVLVTHCLNVSAWDEAERLLLAYIPLVDPLSIPINIKANLFDSQRSPYLFMVRNFADRAGRHRLLFELLEHMVALELLPLEWLATECMRPIWDRLVRTISDGDHRTLVNASRFMETATLASIGLPDERLQEDEISGSIARRFVPSSREELRQALNTTFSSLTTVLCSIALVNNGRDDIAGKEVARRITWALNSMVITISKREDIHSELKMLEADIEDVEVFAQRALWTAFASFLIELEGCAAGTGTMHLKPHILTNSINWISSQYSLSGIDLSSILGSLPSLITSIARGTGRIWRDDGFDQLQRLLAALMALSGCRLPHKLWTLKRLALDSAMEFAHSTGDTQHTVYAREIEQNMRTQGRLVIIQSPEKNESPTSSGGFKWEEGIGEWVVCTPFAKQGIMRLPRKPIRALAMLPTPVQSEDENLGSPEIDDGLPGESSHTSHETTAFDSDNEDAVPHSSPIKKSSRIPCPSLGKRTRASSPKIVIPPKRTHMTPPDTPIIELYLELPEETEDQDGLRRSRRSRTELKALTSRLRTQRSRTSLESGLRNLVPPTYTEVLPEDIDADASSTSSNDSEALTLSAASTHTSRTRSSLGKRRRGDGSDELDELCKTPGRSRSKRNCISGRQTTQGRKEWWKVNHKIVSDDAESEDELSFH
ncbi:Nn.00g025890.m01.CDS01 [Neocucurbitaria sp. VM-36]